MTRIETWSPADIALVALAKACGESDPIAAVEEAASWSMLQGAHELTRKQVQDLIDFWSSKPKE